ncbi:MAG: hypothetical protein O2967_09260 [Proteobacteria bacterium]|nr:hypothetical protein [Pseudomonadota bacterium]
MTRTLMRVMMAGLFCLAATSHVSTAAAAMAAKRINVTGEVVDT